jgi:hypothetical protein
VAVHPLLVGADEEELAAEEQVVAAAPERGEGPGARVQHQLEVLGAEVLPAAVHEQVEPALPEQLLELGEPRP